MKSILVTGSAGFIASHLIEELLKDNVRLEERLKFLETDKTDFGKIAESASTGNTSLRTNQGATSAGAHLKE